MADITIDATLVLPPDKYLKRGFTAAESITAGQLVSAPDASNQVSLAGATDDIYGLALNSAATDQPVLLAKPPTGATVEVILGASTVSDGQLYVASRANDGGISPYEDLRDGDTIRIVGRGSGTDTLVFEIDNTGEVMPTRDGFFIPFPDLV